MSGSVRRPLSLSLSLSGKLFRTCVPARCDGGKGPNISYPFWIPGKHPSHCGYPGFQLTCDSQQPILKLLAFEYIIQDINYEDQSFSVVDRRWIDDTYCPHPFISLTFNYSVFHIGESNLILLFFYNCTQELVPHYQPIPCNSNETHHFFARLNFTGSLMNSSNLPKKCESYVSVPVMMDSKPQESYWSGYIGDFFSAGLHPVAAGAWKAEVSADI